MNKFICLHGHFYQPPRENPWIEAIEVQDSAYPFHDWNQRITAECYEPNAHARILNPKNKIESIINNYQFMSFNFGPTLMLWIRDNAPKLFEKLVEADKYSQQIFNGHGSAIAQAYNHMILPLSNSKDKFTQIVWGITDFKNTFHRDPEGFWLPETAVDLESLDLLAEQNIKFVILAPRQASKIRKIDSDEWQDVSQGNIDSTRPYLQKLPSGRTIAIFFYNGQIAQDLAFGNLLQKGENFANDLLKQFKSDDEEPQLVHVAVDGETYGHHHRYGEMALAYAINFIQKIDAAEIILYADFLERFPPNYEVQIFEYSSWSCHHGVERWKNNCGCNSGMHADWQQNWRAPLRMSLDFLRDHLTEEFEKNVSLLVKDPWQTRNDYIQVINDRDDKSIDNFLEMNAKFCFIEEDRIRLLKWMELERHLMLMYTSCGWFFDEISGIETTQVIQYAARAIQLAKELINKDLEPKFLELLEQVPSNIAEFANGKRIYELLVKPAIVTPKKIAAHYAISSLFEDYEETTPVFCYNVDKIYQDARESGIVKVGLGIINLYSNITKEQYKFEYGVINLGDQNLNCSVNSAKENDSEFEQMSKRVFDNFSKGNLLDILRQFAAEISEQNFTLKDLFRDKQRKIVYEILNDVIQESTTLLEQFGENHSIIINFLTGINIPLPKPLTTLFEFIFNQQLKNLINNDPIDLEKIEEQFTLLKKTDIKINEPEFSFKFKKKLEEQVKLFLANPNDLELLKMLRDMTHFLVSNQLDINLWRTQNLIFDFYNNVQKKPADKSEWHQYLYQTCENINLEIG